MKHLLPVAMLLLVVAAPVPSAGQDTATSANGADTLDVLRPGDVVRLVVWREESFSGHFTVDRTGKVVLPRLGAVDVTGIPADELRDQILAGLGRYLRNPSIDVLFLRRITIHGAVTNAGLYHVDPTMTVLDALALAGGARPDGRLDRIRLIQDGDAVMTVPTTGMQMQELRIRSGDQLFVPEQSWFRRNAALIGTGVSAAASLIVTILILSRE